jgi:hypothetical protein
MSITDSNIKKFKKSLLNNLDKSCCSSRVTKDSSKEHIILRGNQRITINGKSVWSSKKVAQKAIERYIINGKNWRLNITHLWKREVKHDWSAIVPPGLEKIAAPIRAKWAEKNLRVIPLRDYMVLEHNRTK